MDGLCKILLVEDELITRQGLRYLIDWERHGFVIVADAKNGKDALDRVNELRPHVVITDIVMPIVNGLDFLEALHHDYPDIQAVVLSGYSDFEYVKSSFRLGAVDYLLKATLNPADLLKTLETAASRVAGFTLKAGGPPSLEAQFEQALSGFASPETRESLRNSFPEPYFIILATDARHSLGTGADLPSFSRDLGRAADAGLMGRRYISLVYNADISLVALNYGDAGSPELDLERVAKQVALEYPDVFFVCGEPFSGLENLSAAYADGIQPYLRGRFYFQNVNFAHAAQLDSYGEPASSSMDIERLIGENGVPAGISAAYEELAGALDAKSMDETGIKAFAKNAVHHILVAMEKGGVSPGMLSGIKRDAFARLGAARFSGEFAEALMITRDILLKTASESFPPASERDVMSDILGFIDENYSSQLTLAELAKQFNFNYHYLSAYFSSSNAEGFSKYLNHLRLEKAEELLACTDVPVSDISARVGFTDHSYFTRVFKKHHGVTPTVYRLRRSFGGKWREGGDV